MKRLKILNPMKTKFPILICMIVVQLGLAQSHKGNINTISESGLHKLLLSPEIRSASKEDMGRFRIFNAQNKEVPYVVLDANDRQFSVFNPFTILSTDVIKDSVTSLVIANVSKQLLDHLTLQIANTAVNKQFDVSGSNDQKQWFGLISNAVLNDLNNPDSTFVEKTIRFPSNQYAFLRIAINNKKSLPINVLAVGRYTSKFETQQPMPLTGFNYKISEDSKRKMTTIAFTSANSQHIDAIAFNIKTPNYLRNAQLIVKKSQKIKKQTVIYDDVYLYFQLNSTQSSTIDLNDFSQKTFFIDIENQDNQPLEISSITLLQKPLYVIANLKANEPYHVVVDSTYGKPSYDLVNFVSPTTSNVPEASISNFIQLESTAQAATKKAFWQTNAFMWGCIIIGIGVIGYFAMGLLKDMKE